MQTPSPSSATQSDLLKTMQPQSAQNMYVPSTSSNNTGNVRANQQAGGFLRPVPGSTAPPRSGARHVPMQTMYQQTMHQSVVAPTYPQYHIRQPTYQAPPFSFSQPIQPQYYSYQYFPAVQQPQAHQRSTVAVNTAVGSAMSVQNGPNGPLTAPPGVSQAQIPLTAGAVITSAVPPGTSAVLSVASASSTQQVGVAPLVGVLPTVAPPTQTNRRRRHALQIIDPTTKKNILEDLDLTKNPATSESEYQDHIAAPTMQSELQQELATMSLGGGGVIVMNTEMQTGMPYELDMHQISHQRDMVVGQTPIVSAMSDAPSVEILPTPQKPRHKKILQIVPPKDELAVDIQYDTKLFEDTLAQPRTIGVEDASSIKFIGIQQQPLPQYQPIKVANEYKNVQLPLESTISDCSEYTSTQMPIVAEDTKSKISKEFTTPGIVDIEPNVNSKLFGLSNAGIQTVIAVAPPIHELLSELDTVETLESNKQTKSTAADSIDELNRSLHNIQLSEMGPSQTNTDKVQLSIAITGTTNGISSISAGEIPCSTEIAPGGDIVALNNKPINVDSASIAKESNELPFTNPTPITTATACHETDNSDEVYLQTETPMEKDFNLREHTLSEVAVPVDNNNIAASNNIPNNNNSSEEQSTTSSSAMESDSKEPASTIGIPSGTQLLIIYNEGQWSPNNPSGKKQYDREQLLQLREAKASRIQPEVNNVSILPQSNLMPSFVRNNHKRVQSMLGSIGNNRSNDGNGNFVNSKQASMSGVHGRGSMKGGGMIHVNLSLNQDVKLSENDNAWRPRALVKSKDGESDPQIKNKREKDELVRRVRGILNKLTPEKFDTLVEEIIKLKIDTQDKMEEVMVLVFEKAIDEPNFSVSYARLCYCLINEVKTRDERMESGTKSNLAHFRNALLDKTEREFTQNVTQSSAKEKKLQPIIDKIKDSTDPVEKSELEALLDEEERKIRRRSGGTVRFIGELFKISMLTGKIIHSCIDTLLNPKSEDMLECLCKLLTTVGAKFEQTPNSKDQSRCYSLEKMIVRMQAIASKTDKDGARVSSRVRFMLQDVIDLRKNKWQSTRNEAPKTMEQIEKETKTEQLQSHYLNYSGSAGNTSSANANSSAAVAGKRDDRSSRYSDSRPSAGYGGSHSQRGETGSIRRQQQSGGVNTGNNNNNINGVHANGNNDDSAWQVQTSKSSRSLAVDTNKLEGLLNQNLDIGSKKMGGVSQFVWNKTTPSNSFAVLSSLGDSSNKTIDRDRSGGPRSKGSYNKNSMERDRFGGDRGVHSRNTSSQASRENSSSRGGPSARGIMTASSMQKSASHSKYAQQVSSNRMCSRPGTNPSPLGTVSLNPHQNTDNSRPSNFCAPHHPIDATTITTKSPSPAAAAIFEQSNDSDLKTIKSVVSEMIEIATNSRNVNNTSIIACMNRIKDSQRCGFLYYILTDYLHLAGVSSVCRWHLGNFVAYLIAHNTLSVQHFNLAYEQFCESVNDLIVDIPELWLYIFEFIGPLLTKEIITITDLWNQQLRDSLNLGQKFLKTFLAYCTREIGPNFTRNMWNTSNIKWTDFISESEVKPFIQKNKLEYIENYSIHPKIDVKEPREKHIAKVVEHIEHLLKEGSNAGCIIDYINGNIVDIDKQFIRSLTTALCNVAITYKENSYKLETDCFQKVCIPVLQRYIELKEERELECLYSMQLLVHSFEHPRGLLSDLYAELYESDIIPQDSFIKWRDSKDQSAGKGVAVKGLNFFFNHMQSSETSDENN